jgi:hypothetical protein
VRTVLTTLASYPKICPLLGLTHFLFLFLPLCALPLSSPDNPLAVPGSSLSTRSLPVSALSSSPEAFAVYSSPPLFEREARTLILGAVLISHHRNHGLVSIPLPLLLLPADGLHNGYMFMVSDANSPRFQRPRSRRLRRCPSGPS